MISEWLFSESTIAILFVLILCIILWIKRKKITVQKIIFPLLYMLLYKTKWGIKGMDKISKKCPRTIKWVSYTGVYVGFLGMAITVVYLVWMLIKIFLGSTEAAVGVAQPFVQTGFGSPFIYIPFTYFIVAIFIIAVTHEACHGIVARLHKVKIKSSGFAFFSVLLPIIPAAFVEPDEKQVEKLKPMQQLSIFAAGPFSNLILSLIALLLFLAITPALSNIMTEDVVVVNYTMEDNITYPAELTGVGLGESIEMIDNVEIEGFNEFLEVMQGTKPNQTIMLQTSATDYNITLANSPTGDGTGYLGVMVGIDKQFEPWFEEKYSWSLPAINWLLGLLVILFVFNLGVGLINLAPLGPLDGGRMVLTVLRMKYNKKKAIIIWSKISFVTLVILLSVIFLPMILGFFR